MTALTDLTIAEARAGLRKRAFAARELAEAHIRTVEEVNRQGVRIVAASAFWCKDCRRPRCPAPRCRAAWA